MACRLVNLHNHPLSIDLRGGETIVLPPGQTSRALLEELLYDNPFLREWEAAGWLARLPAKFADTQAAGETPPEAEVEAKPAAEPPETEAETEEPADEAEDEGDSESDEDADPDAPQPKPRRRKKQR